MPILSSCGPWLTPGQARLDDEGRDLAALALPARLANTVKKSAMPPLVIQSFSPFSTQSSPSAGSRRGS